MGVRNEGWIRSWRKRAGMVVFIAVLVISGLGVAAAHGDLCGHALHDHDHDHDHHHQCGGHGHHHYQDEHQHVGHDWFEKEEVRRMLPEELAEEEDLKLYGFGGGDHHHNHDHPHHHGAAGGDVELSGIGIY